MCVITVHVEEIDVRGNGSGVSTELPTGKKKKEAALPVYTVRVAHPQYGEVAQYREWIGHLEPGVTAAVLPQVSGYVVQRFFTNGADVKKGQELYRLDDALYRQALARAKEQQAEALANDEEACRNVESCSAVMCCKMRNTVSRRGQGKSSMVVYRPKLAEAVRGSDGSGDVL